MAGNIKGIIVEIGGDTSGLQKALKDVNSKTASLSKELRGINSLLKLDPKNTELLAQKQTVLKQNIEQTAKKLESLREAQKRFIESGGDLNSPQYRNLQREIIKTEGDLKQLNLEASKWTQASRNLSKLSSKMTSFGNAVTEVGKKVSVLSAAIGSLFAAGVKYNADIETATKAFETFLGSAEEAEKAINAIKDQSKASPFDTKDLIKANQYLITTGESAEDSRKTISALADAISLTGGGNDELNRMASNLQQIKNAGKATSMDIRQFAYAGIDVYGILAETTGKNVDELKKMDITYEELSRALIKASGEGGKYFSGQTKMTETLNGQVSTLKKTFQDLIGELSQSLMPVIKSITEKLQGVLEWFRQLDPEQKNMITKIGLIITALGPALLIIGKLITIGGTIAGVLSKVSSLIAGLTSGTGALSGVLGALTGPVGIVIAAVAALTAGIVYLFNTNEEFRAKVMEIWNSIVDLFNTTVMPAYEAIKEAVMSSLKIVWELWQNLWSKLEPLVMQMMDWLKGFWENTLKDIITNIVNFVTKAIQLWTQIYNKFIAPIVKALIEYLWPVVQRIFQGIWSVISGVFEGIGGAVKAITGIFDGLITFISGVFSGDWKKAWEGVRTIFKNIVDGLWSIIKVPLNWIIDGINGLIGGLNKLKIPDWVPGIGGKGINIPKIPRLAQGGVVDKATLAMIGEGKSAEAVIPLDRTLTKYMAEAMRQAGGNPITVNFYPQRMTEAELDRAFNYIDRRYGMAY